MRGTSNLRRIGMVSALGCLLTVGAVATSGQTTREEYSEWQRAQAQAERERRDYLRTRSTRDYRQWQLAQRRAQEEYNEYLRVRNNPAYGVNTDPYGRYNSRYNNRSGMFRIYRNGSYYNTDARGAELLRNAVRRGYQQGYRQGQLDRRYGRRSDYGNVSMYRSGTFGWQSYVDRGHYQHYFQQGFERGYEDGYYNTTRYGTRSGTNYSILGNVLSTILNFAND